MIPIDNGPGGLEATVSITVPTNGVDQARTLPTKSIVPTPSANLVPSTSYVSGTSYDFSSSVNPYPVPVTLTIPFDASKIPVGASRSNLAMFFVSNGVWTPVSGSTVNLTNNTVTAAITADGTYGILVATP